MEPQTQTKKDTVTMTVEIPIISREKLSRLKGIYGCHSLACTVSAIVDDVVLSDALVKVADKERMNEGLAHNDPSLLTDNPITTTESLTDEDKQRLEFCEFLMNNFNESTIDGLTKSGKIHIDSLELRSTDDTIVTDDPETQDKVAFCNGLIIEFMLDGMADLKQHIYDGKLKMIRTDDGDPNEWEE